MHPLYSHFCKLAQKPGAQNTKTVVGVCAAIILKHRQPKMNLLQKIISLILYAGHASKKVITSNVTSALFWCVTFVLYLFYDQVYTRLHKLNLAMSYPSAIQLVDKVGSDHDAIVKEWRDTLLASIHSRNSEGEVSDH